MLRWSRNLLLIFIVFVGSDADNIFLRKGVGRIDDEETIARIVGGTNADTGEYPYYAHAADEFLCGGTLIHPDIVITAAHCENTFKPADVIIGSNDIAGRDGAERIEHEILMVHPDYTVSPYCCKNRWWLCSLF